MKALVSFTKLTVSEFHLHQNMYLYITPLYYCMKFHCLGIQPVLSSFTGGHLGFRLEAVITNTPMNKF